jgi:hypothetical protein
VEVLVSKLSCLLGVGVASSHEPLRDVCPDESLVLQPSSLSLEWMSVRS